MYGGMTQPQPAGGYSSYEKPSAAGGYGSYEKPCAAGGYGSYAQPGTSPSAPGYPQGGSFAPQRMTEMPDGTRVWAAPEKEYHPPTKRVIVKAPRPRYAGAPEFYGNIPKASSTFAWPELCVTADPDWSLSPSPDLEKHWWNTYIYVPERHSHVERQFLERFVPGPDGEWLDVVKARRMTNYFDHRRETERKERIEREVLMSGAAMQNTGYVDAYSGEPLVVCQGELASRETILQEHNVHRSAAELARLMAQDARTQADFDNLRVPWPFGTPYRNKKIAQHTYDWFDRGGNNPYIQSDRDMTIYELPSMYVDEEHYHNLAGGHDPRAQQASHGHGQGVKYVQM
mmetsp:Transcript_85915/g.243665  ORF Transcript_85915/g.243665 Transcript_85915/m.243665 type:complete len:343 (-) Transcript_85915:222-1250(-)